MTEKNDNITQKTLKYIIEKLNEVEQTMYGTPLTDTSLFLLKNRLENKLEKEGWTKKYIKKLNFQFEDCRKSLAYAEYKASGEVYEICEKEKLPVGQVNFSLDVDELNKLVKEDYIFVDMLENII